MYSYKFSFSHKAIAIHPVIFNCSILIIIGCDRPALKHLNKYVRDDASTKWHDLGLELLEPEDEGELNQIRINHPLDNGECCKQMFELWLERYPHATWNQLIKALKEIKLNQLASKIDDMLIKTKGI